MSVPAKNTLQPRTPAQRAVFAEPMPASQYVQLPIINDDLHIVGFEYVPIGTGLRSRIRRMVAEGGGR